MSRHSHDLRKIDNVCYYTPLPSNPASNNNNNNKQASKQASNNHFSLPSQPLLCSNALGSTLLVPSSALTHGLSKSGVSAPKSPLATQGVGAKSGVALQNLRHFGPKIAFFLPKSNLGPVQSGQTKGNGWCPACVASLPCFKDSFVDVQLHDMTKKHPQKGPKSSKICANWLPIAPNHEQAASWAMWLKICKGTESNRNLSLFQVSTPENCLHGCLDQCTSAY